MTWKVEDGECVARCANAAERLVAQARSCGTCVVAALALGLKARAVVHCSFTYYTPGKIEAFC